MRTTDAPDAPRPAPAERSARALTVAGYASGFVGAAAGTAAFADGELALALALWVLTLGIGAVLVAVALLLRTAARTQRTLDGLTARLDAREPRSDGER